MRPSLATSRACERAPLTVCWAGAESTVGVLPMPPKPEEAVGAEMMVGLVPLLFG